MNCLSVLSVGVLKCGLTDHMMNKQMMNKHLVSAEEVMKHQHVTQQQGDYAAVILLKAFLFHKVFSSLPKDTMFISTENSEIWFTSFPQ